MYIHKSELLGQQCPPVVPNSLVLEILRVFQMLQNKLHINFIRRLCINNNHSMNYRTSKSDDANADQANIAFPDKLTLCISMRM